MAPPIGTFTGVRSSSIPTCSEQISSVVLRWLSGYEPILVGRPTFISFQTAAELRYGALRRQWGDKRMRELEARISAAETVHTGPDLIHVYAQLRGHCELIGHALAQGEHDADRWVAATAVRLGFTLVSNDGIFDGAPGLVVESP